MDDGLGKIKVISNHFKASTSRADSHPSLTSSVSQPQIDDSPRSSSWTRRKLRSAAYMLNLFTLRRMPWSSSNDGQEKVVLSALEVESLKSELAELEEREAHLKAQLENVDQILRSARLSGYLGGQYYQENLPLWTIPMLMTGFLALSSFKDHAFSSTYCQQNFYADLSPQDSTLLHDIVEIGPLPSFSREDEETHYAFYILTRLGLRYECSSSSKIQVDSWLSALQTDCKLGSDATAPNGSM
ncbi:uncharacterized protein LOC115975283 isoform X2 [Quercus lobata]|uniref:uncharacterized protein LOC115975283 isoform X2 n=1 Tax=Quercus lobata TaxID=97700 RepID=UPI00124422DE|nr:uncharacterized protein LOC115975283 isoform X2 [Quercus lobata]